MNRKLQRILAVTVVSLLVIPAFSGCEKADTSSGADSNVGPLGKYDPPIELETAMSYYVSSALPQGQTNDDNFWTRAYEKDLGIKVKYRFSAPNNQYTEKLNVYIGSGNIPDMFTVDVNQLGKLIKADLIHSDLKPIYEKYATELNKQLTGGVESDGFQKSTVDGKIRAIPWTESATDSAELMFIRKDWLAKVGLDAPKTIEELEKVLDAFVNQDPDGNGQKDTIGLVGNKDLFKSAASFAGIFNAYGAYPDIWVDDGNGGITYGIFKEEMREPLKLLSRWYKQGLLNEEFAVKDSSKAAGQVMSGKCGVYFGNMATPLWPLSTSKANDPNAEWLILPVPTATGQPAKTSFNRAEFRFHVVSKKCKNPEAMILLMNEFIEKMWGENNEFAQADETSHFALFQAWPATKNLDAYKAVTEAIDSKDSSKLNTEQLKYYNNVKEFLDNGEKLNDPDNTDPWSYTRIFYKGGTQDVVDYYIKNDLYVLDALNTLDTPTMIMKRKTMESDMKEIVTKIIMGEASIDEFDTTIEKVMKKGAEQIIQEANDWYRSKGQ